MIKSYGFYNNHELDNTVLILCSSKKSDSEIEVDETISMLYSEDGDLVGYKIKDFIRFAKIKYSGIIFLPADPLIDIVNSLLKKYDLDTLAYRKESGYITKRDNSVLRVFALKGTFLRDGQISKGQFCSYYDLYINDDHSLFEIEENIPEGIDFFKMEAKGND